MEPREIIPVLSWMTGLPEEIIRKIDLDDLPLIGAVIEAVTKMDH